MKQRYSIYRLFAALVFAFSSYTSIYAQPKKISMLRDFVWGPEDPYKELPTIDDKWKDESAVVVLNHQQHFYTKATKTLDIYFLNRKIIKLNDKAAIKEYSEFNYPAPYTERKDYVEKRISNWMGVKIIKADGTVNEIDVEKQRIAKTNEFNTYLYGFIRNSASIDESYKLAIPDLEVGDYIDYYFYTQETYRTSGTHVMDALEFPLSSTYPTLNYRLDIHAEHDFFINYKAFNGAPELKNLTPEKSKVRHYQVKAGNINKRESTRWFYPLVEDPTIKYQIGFAQRLGDIVDANAYLSRDENVIKDHVLPEEIIKKHKTDDYTKLSYNETNKFLKENKGLGKRELAEKMFYYMRHIYQNRYAELFVAYKNKLVSAPFDAYKKTPFIRSEYNFLRHYCTFLRLQEIPFELIKGKKRYDGTIDDLLIKDNVYTFVKLNFDEPAYVYQFTDSSSAFFNVLPATLEGTDAYRMIFNEGYYKMAEIDRTTLPKTTATQNKLTSTLDLTLTDDLSQIKVHQQENAIGHFKENLYDSYYYWYDMVQEENTKYGTTPFADLLSKRKKVEYQSKLDAYLEEKKEVRQENLEEYVKSSFDFEFDDLSYKIAENGREAFASTLKIEQDFIITDDVIKKAGPNVIIGIGKLIGSQVAITEEEKNRTEGVYRDYPRTINNTINFTIPEGYTVEGLKELNKSISNETGKFISKVDLVGNKLKIETSKVYEHTYEPNSNWSRMLEFLEAAYDFSQAKILLKKQ